MNTIQIGKRTYQVIRREETAAKYPNIAKHGVVAVITAQFGSTIYSIYERANGKFGSAIRAF